MLNSMRPRRVLSALVLGARFIGASWAGAGLIAAAYAQEDPARELERVRAEIERLEGEQAERLERRDDGAAALKEVELALAATRSELAELAESLARQEQRRTEIEAERAQARRNLGGEQAALGRQVRMSYMAGRQELVKLVLSQESTADLGRMLAYYDYLNRARGERIAAVNGQLTSLAALAVESEAVEQDLNGLLATQEQKLARLAREQSERSRLVAELDAAIEADGDRIARMTAEEARLDEFVARLSEILAEFPVASDAPFAEQQGALPWPVEGRLSADFGSPRKGGPLTWDGVLLEAAGGTPVRAVYHGRVAYSDWLPGLGLVLVLDHGGGYMTLYGHNSALLHDLGDWVAPGETIAEVGDTGGRDGAGLYFGIRRDGDPVDPSLWVR